MSAFDVDGIANPSRSDEIEYACDTREENAVADEMQDFHPHHRLTRNICVWEEICAHEPYQLGDWRRHEWSIASAEGGDYPLRFSSEPDCELKPVLHEMTNLKGQA